MMNLIWRMMNLIWMMMNLIRSHHPIRMMIFSDEGLWRSSRRTRSKEFPASKAWADAAFIALFQFLIYIKFQGQELQFLIYKIEILRRRERFFARGLDTGNCISEGQLRATGLSR